MYARLNRLIPVVAAAMLVAHPAAAHHVMGGGLPATFMQGLLSGLGHPVIGIDHLAFTVAIGLAVGLGGLNLLLPVVFIVGSALGVLVHVQGADLPVAELLVAGSVILAGVLVALRARLAPVAWGALFAVAGVVHGYAFGESIAGAEPTPIVAYLIGLALVQAALTSGLAAVVRAHASTVSALAPRIAGTAVAVVGAVFLAQQAFTG